VDWTQIGALKTAYGYTPDPEKRLNGITQSWNNTAIETHSYGYDAVGRLTFWAKAWDGVTRTWTMGYDASEQLETVAETTGGVATNLHHYTYDAAGNRTSEQRGGGVKSWVANGFNQLTQQTVGGEMELRGNVSPKSTVKINNQPAEMREGGVVAASGTEWRKKEIAAAGQNTFSLKATEDAPPGFVPQVLNKTITVNIQPEPQISYQYDADGNMLTDGITSYEWDTENRLVAVTSSPMGRVEFGELVGTRELGN
jgi:YD repeat-containing protein